MRKVNDMHEQYVIFDLETGNAVGGFNSESAALDAVLEAATSQGCDFVDSWGLAHVTPAGTTNLGEGLALIERVRPAGSPADRVSDSV